MTSNFDKIQILDLADHGGSRGHLTIIEGGMQIPFDIKRIFYIYGSDERTVRGQHSNRESEFVLINVAGSCKVRVMDGLGNEADFTLDTPTKGLYLPSMLWKEMYDFSQDSVLLVITNTHYNANEYIRDYHQLEREMREIPDAVPSI